MKILVTGGAGFIGSHVADAYRGIGHRVVVLDNFSTGKRSNLPKGIVAYRADIRNAKAVARIMRKEKPEIVNHHAAMISVADSVRNPLPVYETNVQGTANVLAAFGAWGRGSRKKFIFASSGGAIYGDPKKIPVPEAASLEPLSPYGLSKVLGEKLVAFSARQFSFSYLILRYANVYGPRQDSKTGGVIAVIGALMKRGIRPFMFGDGSKVRDYVYAGDIARANVAGIAKGAHSALNIGCGRNVTDKELFALVAEETGFAKPPIRRPVREGEIYRTVLDISRAKKTLGWKPTVTLEEGVRRTLASL